MTHPLVLSLFPGIDLLGRAFEDVGFQIVRGPDEIWGGDVRTFHVNKGMFSGVIGGPPCQSFSTISTVKGPSKAVDLIDEFVRVCKEASPSFICMENVMQAERSPFIPTEWNSVTLSDWDCGGETVRRRTFWSYPFKIEAPRKREGEGSLSVKATSFSAGRSTNPFVIEKSLLPGDLPLARYGQLQGFEEVARGLEKFNFSRSTIIRLLGNGVPYALGIYVAARAWEFVTGTPPDDRINQLITAHERALEKDRLILQRAVAAGLVREPVA